MAKSDFYTEIDGERLMNELRKRNVAAVDVSMDMGHDRTFISSAISNGKMHNSDVALLKYMLGISKEDILPVEEVKDPELEHDIPFVKNVYELKVPDNFWEKLDETIYNAVRRALEQ